MVIFQLLSRPMVRLSSAGWVGRLSFTQVGAVNPESGLFVDSELVLQNLTLPQSSQALM